MPDIYTLFDKTSAYMDKAVVDALQEICDQLRDIRAALEGIYTELAKIRNVPIKIARAPDTQR